MLETQTSPSNTSIRHEQDTELGLCSLNVNAIFFVIDISFATGDKYFYIFIMEFDVSIAFSSRSPLKRKNPANPNVQIAVTRKPLRLFKLIYYSLRRYQSFLLNWP